jgi:hypothetical protein
VKKGPNLYLTRETLETMKKREVNRLVRRDKQDSNLLSLKKAKNNPKILWGLVDQALWKDRPSLLASVNGVDRTPTTTPLEADEVMNRYFARRLSSRKLMLPTSRRR